MSEVCGFSTGVTIVHRSGGGAKGMGEVCVCVGGLGVQGEPLGNGNPTSDLGVTSDPLYSVTRLLSNCQTVVKSSPEYKK